MDLTECDQIDALVQKKFDKLIDNISDPRKREDFARRRDRVLEIINSGETTNIRILYEAIYNELSDLFPVVDMNEIRDVINDKIHWLSDQPIDSAWFASIALMAVSQAEKNLGIDIDEKTEVLVQKCVSWLKDKNNQTDDLLWGSNKYNKGITNIFDTSFALIALEERGAAEPSLIEKGSEYIKRHLIKEYGGWSPIPGSDIDTGATSWAIIALVAANESRFSEYIAVPKAWLLLNQRDDGGWSAGYNNSQAQSVIARTYDAVEALLAIGETPKSTNIKKAVNWIIDLQKLINEKGEWGRGWESSQFPGTDIYQSDSENTATALMILLKCGQDPNSLEVIAGINWLLKRVNSWEQRDTPRIIICLSLYHKLKMMT